MKKTLLVLLSVTFMLFAFASGKGKKVAIVKIAKGKATVVNTNGDKLNIQKGQWIEQGSVIKTEKSSFVKLSFIDKSTVNVGPNSEMKIERFSKNEAGVLNVISGKIRSKVTKDYLNMEKDKSKLFVRSKSAVMGIRGTDFIFSTSKKTGASTAILFEGSVVFNKVNKKNKMKNLESIVNKGFRIKPGQFSVAHTRRKRPTVPSKLSTRQFVALEKNKNFVSSSKKIIQKKIRSVTPPGLTGEIVASDNQLKIGKSKKPKNNKIDISKTKGFVKGNQIKPVDGSIVHIESGAIIPIGNDAHFDRNSKEWVSNSSGSVDDKGAYIPPKSFKITDEGKLIKNVGNNKYQVVDIQIKPLDDTVPLDQANTSPLKKAGKSPASIDDRFDGQDSSNEDLDTIPRAPQAPGQPEWLPGEISGSNRPGFRRSGPRPVGPNRTRVRGTVNRNDGV
jgi:hypothetical protein